MSPGVTNLPAPSMITASVGAARLAPTPAILPSRRSTAPFWIVGPAAVITVTFRISVVRDGNGRYVLGKGSALGDDTAPAPGAERLAAVVCCAGCCCDGAGADCAVRVQAATPRTARRSSTRISEVAP